MPLVVITRNPEKLDDEHLSSLTKVLCNSVCDALICSNDDGFLSPSDIEIRVQNFGPYDVNTKDIEIMIWSNLYPEREKNIKNSRRQIIRAVKKIIPSGLNGFVWILLQPSSFGEF